MAVHVSIHDVSPAWELEVDKALSLCDAVGAKAALLVVPDFHGSWRLDEHPEFCARLRQLQQHGHEIYLHGLHHRAVPSETPSDASGLARLRSRLRAVWTQRVVSAGEAEFAGIDRAEAARRLDRGRVALRDVGLTPTGFVPPAWTMPAWCLDLLAERGIAYTEDHVNVYNPVEHRRRPSVVLNFASRTTARMLSTVAYCRVARYARAVLPARVAIHPGDMRRPLLVDEVAGLLHWAKDDFVESGKSLLDAT